MTLLTTGNPKTRKGESKGWSTAILHLAPAKVSGYNVCPASTHECRNVCLNTAGRGGIPQKGHAPFMNAVQAARVRRTRMFFEHREEFLLQLAADIRSHAAKAKRDGLRPAVRLNGTSDIAWEHVRLNEKPFLSLFPGVRFYDYTKILRRALEQPYHLTFSRGEGTSDDLVIELLDRGVNVAVVFREVPKKWLGRRVVNGDVTDLRFLDPKGVIVGLRAKGDARRRETTFVL